MEDKSSKEKFDDAVAANFFPSGKTAKKFSQKAYWKIADWLNISNLRFNIMHDLQRLFENHRPHRDEKRKT